MRVKCIKERINLNIHITENKIYNVTQIYNFSHIGVVYEIFDDLGRHKMINEHYFIKLKNHRKEILDDI